MIGIRLNRADRSIRRMNELYWKSDRTVDQITAELGVTRSALYSGLTPLPAGKACPACGGALGYDTRTNRASHTARCESCGNTTHVEPEGSGQAEGGTVLTSPQRRWPRIPLRRVMMIGGAAALGAVLGTAAIYAFRDT